MGTDKHKTPWIQNPKKIQEPGGLVVGGLVKRDFITHSVSSEHSLDSESKFEPSVAKARFGNNSETFGHLPKAF